MKTIILCLLMLFTSINFQAQEVKQDSLSQVSNNYLTKSIRQRKLANVFAISGGGLILVGTVVAATGKADGWFFSGQQIIGAAMILAGTVNAIVSIPIYVVSYINKRKSLKISPSISFQKPVLVQENFAQAGVLIQF